MYRQCDELAVFSHNLSSTQCDTAFRCVRDIVLFIKSGCDSEESLACAFRTSDDLESLIDAAVNEDWMGHTSTE